MANICELIRKKNIKLELIKVKVHTGIEGNEIADELAREEINRVIDNLDVDRIEAELNCIRATLMWWDHSIEMKIRKFVKTINVTDQ